MKVRASDWVKEIFDNYKHIPMKDVTREALYELITKDSGVNMVRKAKEAIGVLQNTLNPAWKDPDAFASGTQLGDALTVCKQVAWIRNEEDKKEVAGKKGIDYAIRPFDANWNMEEWLSFLYLGLPAGRLGSIIFTFS